MERRGRGAMVGGFSVDRLAIASPTIALSRVRHPGCAAVDRGTAFEVADLGHGDGFQIDRRERLHGRRVAAGEEVDLLALDGAADV